MKPACVVIFPLYKAPNALERYFLENGLTKLSGFDCVIVAPETLEIDKRFGLLTQLEVLRFKDDYFKDIQGYNRLLLSREFYTTFASYEHLLIHQADVFVFSNQLQYWCDKGYAYIGAPWFRPREKWYKYIFNQLRKIVTPTYGIKHNLVGNGGFSLRNIEQALTVLEKCPETTLDRYRKQRHHLFNEDVFWSLEAPKILSTFRIPLCEEALAFGIEFNPSEALKLLDGRLPFGCHAPLVHGKSIWRNYIPGLESLST